MVVVVLLNVILILCLAKQLKFIAKQGFVECDFDFSFGLGKGKQLQNIAKHKAQAKAEAWPVSCMHFRDVC